MGHYTKRTKDGKTYHGHDRSDAEPGFYQLPDWQLRAILKAYKEGDMTTREIAKEFNCHERTVRRWARDAGLPPKTTAYSDALRQSVYEAYVYSKENVVEIARRHGIPNGGSGSVRQIAERWAETYNLPWRVRLQGGGRGNRRTGWWPWIRPPKSDAA